MDREDEHDLAGELGHKLVVALRSVSDPAAQMQAISDRNAAAVRRDLMTRIDAIDTATKLWHDDLVRVPTEVQKAIAGLRDALEQLVVRHIAELRGQVGRELERIGGQTAKLDEVSEERFRSIQTQFLLLKQATEQLDLANKTAIAAALQAQKESAGETQKSSQAAIQKSETSTAEQIKALTATFQTDTAGIKQQITDLKSRMDRGEGQSGVTDPTTALALREMARDIASLSKLEDRGAGAHDQRKDANQFSFSLIAAVVAFGAFLVAVMGYVHTFLPK